MMIRSERLTTPTTRVKVPMASDPASASGVLKFDHSLDLHTILNSHPSLALGYDYIDNHSQSSMELLNIIDLMS